MKKKEEINMEEKVEQSQEAQQASEDVSAQAPSIEKAQAPEEELLFGFGKLTDKQRKKRAVIISVSAVVVLIVLFALAMWLWFFIVNYPIITVTHKNIDDLKINYTLTEDGQYISNINYDAYLSSNSSVSIFAKKIYLSEEGVSEDNTAIQNTTIIQNLIDNQEGGAAIYVDGNYKIKSLKLKDKIDLVIEEDCSLIGPKYGEFSNVEAIISAKDAKDISILGPGTIVGNGVSYTNDAKDESLFTPLAEFNVKERVLQARKRLREAKDDGVRPHIIKIDNCSNVKIQNIRLYEAAFWTVNVIDSNNITFKDVVIDNNIHVANADGIDIVSSQKVRITHCFIATADDGVCIKAFGNENVDDVLVDRCSILSMANNFKIGTETSKDIEKVDVTNCYFFMPENVVGGYSGIAVESADGSNVSNVYVDNIYMQGISSPVLIWLGDRLNKKNGSDGKVGSITDVTISNITANNVEMASAVTGCVHNDKTYYVKKVELANFNITYRNTGENLHVGTVDFEESMNGYPEITRVLHNYILNHEMSVYDDIPVYGLFARHVDGLKVYNLNVTARSCNELQRDNITQAKDRYDVLNVKVN